MIHVLGVAVTLSLFGPHHALGVVVFFQSLLLLGTDGEDEQGKSESLPK